MSQVSLSEAAKHFGITRQGVLNRVKSGKVEGVQVDGRWLITIDDVDLVHEGECQQVDGSIDVLRAEVERLKHENALLQAKVDGMESVLTAIGSVELIGKLTALFSENVQVPAVQVSSEKAHKFLWWRW